MNKDARSLNMLALRDIIFNHSTPFELAGDAASVLSCLPIKEMKAQMDKKKLINPPGGSRDEYTHKALTKLVELAEEFQKEFSAPTCQKFGDKGPRPELN